MKVQDLNLSAMKYFIDAVAHESITKSSQINHVSRPAVSQAILKLGDWYGKPLLEHEKRSFALTAAGIDFYQKALKSYASLRSNFSQDQDPTSSFRLGCSASLLDLVFPFIKNYLRRSDGSEIKFGTTDQLLERLTNGQINLAFTIEKSHVHGFRAQQFHAGCFQVLSPSGFIERNLVTTEDRPETESFDRFLLRKKIRPDSRWKVESWTMAARLAVLGAGCCLVPDFISTPGLRVVKTRGWQSKYIAMVYSRKTHELSRLEKDCLEQIRRGRA